MSPDELDAGLKGQADEMDETYEASPDELEPGLGIIRRRRWYLWAAIIVYMPVTWTTLVLTQSYRITGYVFGVWVAFLVIAVTLTATVRCPRCGEYFHMRNGSLLFRRSCRHCGLHIKGVQKEL